MAYKYKAEIKSVDERLNLPIQKEVIMDGPNGTEEIVEDMLLNGGCEKVDVKVSLYDEKFDEWYGKRQEWNWRHSWFSERGGSFLPLVFFRKVDDQIEIEWDSTAIYEEEDVYFINPKGLHYIDLDIFKQVVEEFLRDQKREL